MNIDSKLSYARKIGIVLLASFCFFSPVVAEEVGTYTDLRKALANPSKVFVLDLSSNKLEALPIEIGQLQKLKILNISNNLIDLKDEEKIQKQLYKLWNSN
ncbi:leucine-rich repeat domain-containing protein [Leptospira mayottensis]|uniref:Leucine rich repeat protein n=2 Tax=Leptospira mayottensis TaxID=1137606 RepID=A0AA87MTQ5_9LEPT|nr:leucine-rich repeat domain-containing protein [Leptospira mayottensis]AXR61903.1 hypothetical protein DQM68_15680 [Leptospira mayottensis]AXR65815.1 hypothetical protein DQM28_18000 [Leptospira mayottensis]AZQ01646.1 hypothetical protein LEP1GSC190_06040 [Leptospira mayottensis 200901116]EKS01772.1 leucine rich repeat protein [Leptospira mayottensis 200901122]TGM95343.1 hypothetical protein EHR03_16895 [Leptospira mayottensis]